MRQVFQYRGQRLATHIVKIAIDAVGAQILQTLLQVIGLVVNGGYAPLLANKVTLLGSARDADHPASSDVGGQLTDDGAHTSRRARKHQGIVSPRFTARKQTCVGRQTGHAQGLASVQCWQSVKMHPKHLFRWCHGADFVGLPANLSLYQVALAPMGMSRFDNLCDTAAMD